MNDLRAGAEDYASMDRAADELRRRGWRTSFSPNAVVDDWESFVESVEDGYTMTIDDYTNDLSIRRVPDEARPFLTGLIAKSLDDRLAPLDARFRVATEPAARLPGAGDGWWAQRLPRLLVGELAEDVQRLHLR